MCSTLEYASRRFQGNGRQRNGTATITDASPKPRNSARVVCRPDGDGLFIDRGGNRLGDRAQLGRNRIAMPRFAQERLDPRLGAVVFRHIVFDEQPAEQDPDSDVGEGPEREQLAGRIDELVDRRVVGLKLFDDRADRLVNQRQPDLLRAGHCPRSVGAVSYTHLTLPTIYSV